MAENFQKGEKGGSDKDRLSIEDISLIDNSEPTIVFGSGIKDTRQTQIENTHQRNKNRFPASLQESPIQPLCVARNAIRPDINFVRLLQESGNPESIGNNSGLQEQNQSFGEMVKCVPQVKEARCLMQKSKTEVSRDCPIPQKGSECIVVRAPAELRKQASADDYQAAKSRLASELRESGLRIREQKFEERPSVKAKNEEKSSKVTVQPYSSPKRAALNSPQIGSTLNSAPRERAATFQSQADSKQKQECSHRDFKCECEARREKSNRARYLFLSPGRNPSRNKNPLSTTQNFDVASIHHPDFWRKLKY